MKKIKIILTFLIISTLFITKINAEETITIESIELDYISTNAIEKSSPVIDGLSINLDVQFREVNNYIKYKLLIKNNTNEEYELKEDTSFLNNENITYKYYKEGKIKPNSENIIYLVVSYNQEVEESKFVENKYTEENKAILEIVDDSGEIIKNPKTGNDNITFIILSIVLVISCIVLFTMKKKDLNNVNFIFIMLLINCIPLIVNATQLFKLNLNVNVEIIKNGYHVIYAPDSNVNKIIDIELLEDYEIINNKCNNIYMDNQKEEVSYVMCEKPVLLKSKKIYMPGDEVEMLIIQNYKIKNEEESSNYCTLEENNIYCSISESTAFGLIGNNNSWVYGKDAMTDMGYTYSEDDLEKMEFSFIIDNFWDEENEWSKGGIEIGVPSVFKMPAHDVFFYYLYPV